MAALRVRERARYEAPALVAVLDGMAAGHVFRDRNGRFRFSYLDEWQKREDAYPLSISLPLALRDHEHAATEAFLHGLLPDNDRALAHYGRLFGVSAANPAALLAHLGADCPGAVQFSPPDRFTEMLDRSKRASITWLDEAEVASELRTVREQGVPSGGRRAEGQFSLAGAQPKIALLEEKGRWGRPSGRAATNVILKPPSSGFPGFAENEHLCLALARELKLGAVHSRVLRFDDEVAIAVDRFDRARVGTAHVRIHQEDCCQALGIHPRSKYQSDGGPGVAQIVRLIREVSSDAADDLDRFLSAIALNWMLVSTDGHAKNYALLIGAGGSTRLAPFYDIASFLPYAEAPLYRIKLAMKIGSEYLVRKIGRRHWEALARDAGLPVAPVLEKLHALAEAIPEAADAVEDRAIEQGLNAKFVRMLVRRIKSRADDCLRLLSPVRAH